MNTHTSTNTEEMVEDPETDDEKLLILPLNDRNSKKISQIISSDTARNILEVIASAPRSTSEIADKLGIPLTTVQYNLEKLCDAGLVKVERTTYSRKMKPVKLYAPQRKLVVIVPEKTNRMDVVALLKRYVMAIAVAVVGSAALELLAMRMGGSPIGDSAIRSVPEGVEAPAPLYAPLPAPTPEKAFGGWFSFDLFTHPGLWFLLGALFIILVILLIEYRSRKQKETN